jgi:hypothetical protein
MNRPLSSKKIEELEQLFKKWRGTPCQLRILLHELRHHKRRRAAALRAKIEVALKRAGATANPTPSLKQMELPFDSSANVSKHGGRDWDADARPPKAFGSGVSPSGGMYGQTFKLTV